MPEPSNDVILKLVVATDDELLAKGLPPGPRMMHVVIEVMKKLGHVGFVFIGLGKHPMADRIASAYRAMYRPSDLAIGGIHGGIFMFRDIFGRISIPLGFGRVGINPFTMTDLSDNQLRWLADRPADRQMFLDQFADIFDVAGGIGPLGDYKVPPKPALELFHLAAFQLQGAAAALSVAFDFRGAIQSALIGAELALKAGLAAEGADEAALKAHGHRLASSARAFAATQPNFDIDRVLAAIERLPHYVENRYSAEQPRRMETGHIVMRAQYIAGEVMRQIAGFTIRSQFEGVPRAYPPIETSP